MSEMAVDSTSRGISVDVLIAISSLGCKIATDRNENEFAPNHARSRRVMLTRGAAVSEAPMIEFRPYGNMEWRFGVQLGNSDRLWFCRNTDDDDAIYYFEDSIFPQAYSEQECIELIDYLESLVEGLTML